MQLAKSLISHRPSLQKLNQKLQQSVVVTTELEKDKNMKKIKSNYLTRITVEVEVHQEQENSQPSTLTLPIEKNKTSRERVREFRARKKSLTNLSENIIEDFQTSSNIINANNNNNNNNNNNGDNNNINNNNIDDEKNNVNIRNNTRRIQDNDLRVPYSTFHRHQNAHNEFKEKFINNSFGHVCSVCDRLWFEEDLKSASVQHKDIKYNSSSCVKLQNCFMQHMS
ncbi:J domain-containing protein DDB_G0295729-like [Cotesia glomerata]|uniref:J domain-containing protein DDB_G0295729-like n=1 Tax=Cotesia glomerata TaxID=32391 RepID=UPI001D002A07|nr:J domain-containing protein DDB_G0295729-like [Cotesia glomerata]XP_044593073.1 J domain-containing protein DDB_G0295729-like [Cotesia glomerata]